MAATASLREALSQGISSGSLVDTKIILYSHRDSSGRVYRPKVLYANSHVLKTVPYFDNLLFGNFTESQSRDFTKEAIDEEESAEDYGYLSDSDLEDDEDEKVAPVAIPGEDQKILCEEHEEHVEKGKIVKIPDIAFVTFQAFLMYLYTDAIEFAPFGSKENRRSRSAEIVTPSDVKVPRPSPKSIYRLADKYDIHALKGLALSCIRGELEKCNIVREAFSRFVSRYDEMRSLYVNQLASVWMNDSTTETTRTSFNKEIDNFVNGKLEHASEMLSALLEIVSKDGDINAPSGASPATTQVVSPTHWAVVKIALIKSIRTGVFFDRKHWARHFKSGGVLKPVYFSSIIMDDKVQQLNNLVIYLKDRSALINYLEGDADLDSDCESDSRGVENGASKTAEEGEEQALAVLTTGSFSAWKALFFYRCTDMISFAPLKSQGVDSRSNYIRGIKATTTTPPPCSPKNIYVLANLVRIPQPNVSRMTLMCRLELGIRPLCDRAFADIERKVSLDNVVVEVFSWVTARQEKIVEMQCDILISNLKNPKTIALMRESIGNISGGSSPHCAGALKLGFEKAFELKKRERGVQLQCPNRDCVWYNSPVSYFSVGSDTYYCPKCSRNRDPRNRRTRHYLQCTGCRSSRTSSYESCQNCEKRFI